MMRGGRTAEAGRALPALLTLLMAGVPPPAASQFVVLPSDSACPTNQLFLGSFDDDHIAYAPLAGMYSGVTYDTSDSSPATRYRHELGHAFLTRYTSQKSGSTVTVWYVEREGKPASEQPALPAAGRVLADDASSPMAHIRSVPSGADQSPWEATWQVWTGTVWQEPRVTFPGRNANASCASLLRVSCVGEAWRCPAGRLHVSGMSVGMEKEAASSELVGRLAGADQAAFSKQFVASDDAAAKVDAPFPAASDGRADDQRLGTFLLTDTTHVNRPVYRHARPGSSTFLYFDRLLASDGSQLPLWIVGPEPSRVDLAESRLFFAVDAARRPEEISGCWQYLAAGRQLPAHLNATCEHGRQTAQALDGADCRFELPGACGYSATDGQLRQVPYSAEQQQLARQAGDDSPGAFFAELTSDEGKVVAISRPFSTATNSCITLYYRMRTESYFGAKFNFVNEADGARTVMQTMFSKERDWTRVGQDVPAGRYRLEARTTDLAEGDALQLDSVRVVPGSCSAANAGSPCHRRPCDNGGTCVPTGDKSYTCLCPPDHNDRDCRATKPCPPPPQVKFARSLAVPAASSALQTTAYQCQDGYELTAPLTRSVATCRAGLWRGEPTCRRGADSPEEVGPGGGATGLAPPAAVAAVALAAAVALRAALLFD